MKCLSFRRLEIFGLRLEVESFVDVSKSVVSPLRLVSLVRSIELEMPVAAIPKKGELNPLSKLF